MRGSRPNWLHSGTSAAPGSNLQHHSFGTFCLVLTVVLSFAGHLEAREQYVILPSKVALSGPTASQGLVLERVVDRQYAGQVTGSVAFASANTNIVRIVNGAAVPVVNGSTTILARWGGETVKARVEVTGMERPVEWSFRNHVQPVLAKFGCSSGACHGAAAGQNGFRLSLRGYDDQGDYLALTRQALGRRIIPSDPGRSLLLLKPTGAVPHKGGRKFDTDSLEYRVLSEWIAAGAPGPKEPEPRIDRLEVMPRHVTLAPDASQQMSVRAVFSDGRAEDVTRWVKYTDSNATVTQTDEAGRVKVLGQGEGAITAWYLSRIAIATVSVPYSNNLPRTVFAQARGRNFIDELVLEKLRSLNLPPSPACSDAEFIRRAFLDTIGTLPTAAEARAFLEDAAPGEKRRTGPAAAVRRRWQKRDRLIESLLNRPEFIDYWTYKWCDLLLVSSKSLRPPAMWAYYDWIRKQVAANTPWDVFARRVVTAQGNTLDNGAANFFVLHEDPRTLVETTSQAFLGMSITCAKCHNHPMEKWTNNDYYGMANLYARVRAKNGSADGERIIFAVHEGDLAQPLTGRPQPPRPLDGHAFPFDDPIDRRERLAAWLTARDNPYFSRAVVNRVWANFFGVGLVEAVDDLRVTNPASNERLLAATANFLADQKFDLKALMRAILQSETYQRASEPLPGNMGDTRFYSRYYPRRLMAEVLLDAVSQATGVPTAFVTDLRNANQGLGSKYPAGVRALQLPDSQIDSYFLRSFGRAARENTCECERTEEPSVAQVLHLANGDTINQKLAAKLNVIGKQLAAQRTPEQMIAEAYLSTLSRQPTEGERNRILAVLKQTGEPDLRATWEDVYWALLSSKEFLFNH